MIVEISFLVMALVILCFHRPISDFILEQEQQLASRLTQMGIFVPQFPSREFARDLYFVIGVVVSLAAIFQLWAEL